MRLRNSGNANLQFVLIFDDKTFLNLYYEAMLMTVHKTFFLIEITCFDSLLTIHDISLHHNLANLC
jgi:hypothetical protein